MSASKHLLNPELIARAMMKVARDKSANVGQKRAFIPAGDPAMTGDPAAGGGGGGMPMDPAAAGMDPAAAGMDPAAGGGAPPAGGGAMDPSALQSMIQQTIQQAMAGGAGAAGGGGMAEPIKPKIDVNVEIMQMKKLLAHIADALKIPIPAADMVATTGDLTQMAQQGQQAGQAAAAGAGGAGAGGSMIEPIEPMPAAMPGGAKQGEDKVGWNNGTPFSTDGFSKNMNTAQAIAHVWQHNGAA